MTPMHQMKRISVIIVSWNARDYLLQCLASLRSEAGSYPMEIIVVDNASTDNSPELVENLHPEVMLIRNAENLGFAKANNIGVRASTGDYLCFINSDVRVLPGCLASLVRYCEEHPETGMAGPYIIGADGKLQRSCRGFPSLWNMFCRALALDTLFRNNPVFTSYSLNHWAHDAPRKVDILSGCFWFIPRRALLDVGLLDEAFFIYGEDMDWCRRFWNKGWHVAFVPAGEAIHYGGASSSNAPLRFFIEMQKANLQYWKKHHSRTSVACYLAISCLHLMLRLLGYYLGYLAVPTKRHWLDKAKMNLAGFRWIVSQAPL